MRILATVVRALTSLFLRRWAGKVDRRLSRASKTDDNQGFPALPPPWNDDARWYRGDFPPRSHNSVLPLPHGATYFADLCSRLATARQRVTIVGWTMTPRLAIVREGGQLTELASLLAQVSDHVEIYVLLWTGAPFLFQPDRKAVEEARAELLESAPRIRCELDRTANFSHDHHQKAVTIDGHTAYVGGIDLTTFQGDRWDTDEHPLRSGIGWHDVQVRVEGEIVADVERNFCQRWSAATGEVLVALAPEPRDGGHTAAQLVRTIPRPFHLPFAPRGEYGIKHALLHGIANARRFVYMESQYLWAPEIVTALCEAMDRGNEDFRIALVLPAQAYDGRYDNDYHIGQLVKHDGGRGRFAAYSLYSWGPAQSTKGYRYSPIYVHAKVTIVDDEWMLVGSANLNDRGLTTDSEIGIHGPMREEARNLRWQLWAEHLGMTVEEVAAVDPIELLDREWPRRALETERLRESEIQGPPWHIHPYTPGGTPQSRLFDRVQALTLEH